MRCAFFILAFILSCLGVTGHAWAQKHIGVRAGDHKEYSRIVLDGAAKAPYKKNISDDGKLTVIFQNDVVLDVSQMPDGATGNILGYSVDAKTPNTFTINIPSGSRIRDFKIGQKLVFDIYDPPGGRQTASKKEEPKNIEEKSVPEEAAPQASAAKEDKKKIEKPDDTAASETNEKQEMQKQLEGLHTDQMSAQSPAVVEEKPEVEAVKETQIKIPENAVKPNLISLSSTQEFGMGAFENRGNLFLITTKSDEFLKPQISGPTALNMFLFEEMPLEEGKVFRTKLPMGLNIRAEGRGLLWRVIVGGKKQDRKAIIPERKDVREKQLRSGSIFFPLKGAGRLIDIKDPFTGENFKIVTVTVASEYNAKRQDFIDFDVLPSVIGLLIRPKADDLQISITDKGVEISRPEGLALMTNTMLASAKANRDVVKEESEYQAPIRMIYKFNEWRKGGMEALHKNKNTVLSDLKQQKQVEQVENLILLSKMYLANVRGSEALGFLRFAAQEMPEIQQTPEYIALRGAAKALSWKSAEAFRDLSNPVLKEYGEIDYWRAFVLADLGDWEQAAEVMPERFAPLYSYPKAIRDRVGITLAEIALRAGKVNHAEELLGIVEGQDQDQEEDYGNGFEGSYHAALQYLKGEAARQRGKIKDTFNLWQPLTEGRDDLYRAKAGLALTRLLMEEGKLDNLQAIDQLERLRYSWRGDELEAQINYWLGKLYFDQKEYVKGLTIMRDAVTSAPDTDMGRKVTKEMASAFEDLYLGPKLEGVSPLDAVAIYEQFSELVPTGAKGDRVVERLAEHLVRADLLSRAGDLLEYQVEHRLKGVNALNVAVRLAGIRLLDLKPDKALQALDKAAQIMRTIPVKDINPARVTEMTLLRARALSKQGKTDQALALLNAMEPEPNVNKLKVSIAWNAGYWDDAAEALDYVISDEAFSLSRPLSEEHAAMLLNRAIALNLASDRIGLSNMREKYSDAMSRTDKARMFEVVTRARQSPALADRQTLLSITSEVDMFSDFMSSYRKVAGKDNEAEMPAELPVPPSGGGNIPQGAQDGAAATGQ